MSANSIWFLGGVGTVTGSKFLIEGRGKRVLVDCGLFQGLKELRLQNWGPFPIDPATIDSVILTHAHLDHCGYLPLLVKQGFRGKVYCTDPTKDLAKIILLDAAHIQEEDAAYANRMGYTKHAPAKPLYTSAEALASIRHFSVVVPSKWHTIAEGFKFRFINAGHILGSSIVEIVLGSTRIAFSGDLGRSKPLMLPKPEVVTNADYLIVESTYGDGVHPSEPPHRTLARIINETYSRRGVVVIPSFAVGRTQDLLYLIHKLRLQGEIPKKLPVFVDSPMGITATEIFLEHPEWHKLGASEVMDFCSDVTMVRNAIHSSELIASKKPSIVIAGSGMLSGGRVLHHLAKRLPDPKNSVILVGYQAAGTRGRLLRDGINELKLHGQYIPVKARIEEIRTLSAHADQKEILAWMKNLKKAPKGVFVVHGEPQAADALRVRIRDMFDWPVEVIRPFELKRLAK